MALHSECADESLVSLFRNTDVSTSSPEVLMQQIGGGALLGLCKAPPIILQSSQC